MCLTVPYCAKHDDYRKPLLIDPTFKCQETQTCVLFAFWRFGMVGNTDNGTGRKKGLTQPAFTCSKVSNKFKVDNEAIGVVLVPLV